MDLKKARLLVTPTSYGKNDPRLKTELEALAGAVIYNPTGKPLSSPRWPRCCRAWTAISPGWM